MKLVWAHAQAHLLELRREPGMLFPTVLLPGLLFLFFGRGADTRTTANLILTGYMVFAVVGIAFFQFGVNLAHERGSPWELFLRTLPLAPPVRFAARILMALLLALAAAGVVVTLAQLLTSAALPLGGWLRWGV